MLRLISFAALAALFVATALNAQPSISGALSGTLGPGTYIVNGECRIEHGDTLEILPGTVFLHSGHFTWQINGQLEAVGTETDSIVWKRQQPYSTYRWGGLRFTPTIPYHSRLEYCVIEGAYNGRPRYGGGIYVEGNELIIRNCRIYGCQVLEDGGGIYGYYSTQLLVENCVIDSNLADIGAGIYLNLCNGARVKDCVISRNRSSGT